MVNVSPYEKLAATYPGFAQQFEDRVARGDTLSDLQFWIRTHYDVKVSTEAIRQWRLRLSCEI